MSAAGFKRLHCSPRAVLKGATLRSLTPRGAWLKKRSEERYLKRDDAYGLAEQQLVGEIGTVGNIRFISSPQLGSPPPSHFCDALLYGISAYQLGMDPGDGDFTFTHLPAMDLFRAPELIGMDPAKPGTERTLIITTPRRSGRSWVEKQMNAMRTAPFRFDLPSRQPLSSGERAIVNRAVQAIRDSAKRHGRKIKAGFGPTAVTSVAPTKREEAGEGVKRSAADLHLTECMEMNIDQLTGALLDYWTGRAEGIPADQLRIKLVPRTDKQICVRRGTERYDPSTNANTGWPIIQRLGIRIGPYLGGWEATYCGGWYSGATGLEAAMRAYVASEFGTEIPEYQPPPSLMGGS